VTSFPLLSGLRGFVIVWIGQVISLLGTAMSGFGLTIWVYKLTGSATALSLMGFFFVTPMLITSPLAGPLVGVGPGAGIALIIIFSGLGMMRGGLCGYLVRAIREAESILPDHAELPVSAPAD